MIRTGRVVGKSLVFVFTAFSGSFVLAAGSIYKVDKSAGGAATKVGQAQMFGGVLVNGGNVYWSAAGEDQEVAPGVYTACK